MKTVKETIYEHIQREIYNVANKGGVETKDVAQALDLHRSNVSAALNALVKEGKLVKTNTRPVLYQLPVEEYRNNDDSVFDKLIGSYGSLRNAIQLAKAAILYPRKSLNVLISAHTGSGTSYFATLMFEFAQATGVIAPGGKMIKINCRHYSKDFEVLNDELFGVGGDLETSCFARAHGGMLFIDNVDMLEAKQLSLLLEYLDSGKIYSEDRSQMIAGDDILLVLSCAAKNSSQLNRSVPMMIELPQLKDRPLRERYNLINHFFQVEAANSDRTIEVPVEVMKALLQADFDYNVKGLELEIKSACANAYVRVVNDANQDMCVLVEDFKGYVKKSLLKVKSTNIELELIIDNRGHFIFNNDSDPVASSQPYFEEGMYLEIKKQYEELAQLGISDKNIENVMDRHIKGLFKKYLYFKGADEADDTEQLAKIVDARIIGLVKAYLEVTAKELGKEFKSNVFYGLCLHINSLLTLDLKKQRVDNDQVVKIIQEYPAEYAASVDFAGVLKNELDLDLPIHEIVMISMFLIESEADNEEAKPVMLYIMHGEGTAASLKEVTNRLTRCDNAYSYDLSLDKETTEAMAEIKELIEQIDTGGGVVAIYDMGSIKTMLDTIAEQIKVKIRYINIPLTLIGIDTARKCAMEPDIDYVYHTASLELRNTFVNSKKSHDVIITLCHTGEGGATQLKHYIDQYSKLNMKTIALSISNRESLLAELFSIQKTYNIHAFVGTYDPKLLGIPFISIAKVFENSKDDLDRILMFEPISSRSYSYNEVYNYLSEQFSYVSINKLKAVLPDIIDEFSVIYNLNEDQRGGLFMHLACLAERLLEGKSAAINEEKNKIISVFEEDYDIITKILKKFEKTFKIIIDDNEMATIIMIIKRI